MATKKRKRRSQSAAARPRSYSQLYKDEANLPADATVAEASENGESPPIGSGEGHESVDWKNEYAYVVKDLRVLVIVSVAIFVVMIGVGLFI